MQLIKEEYSHAFSFAKKLKWFFLITIILFLVAAVVSHFAFSTLYKNNPELMKTHFEELTAMINSKGLSDEDGSISAIGLFKNNFIASLMSLIMGFVPFLYVPLLSLGVNAVLIGMVSAVMDQTIGGGLFELLVSIAPHGIFELPALFLCVAGGMFLCTEINAKILYRPERAPLLQTIGEMARMIILITVPLLIAAAVIEAHITPLLMQLLLK